MDPEVDGFRTGLVARLGYVGSLHVHERAILAPFSNLGALQAECRRANPLVRIWVNDTVFLPLRRIRIRHAGEPPGLLIPVPAERVPICSRNDDVVLRCGVRGRGLGRIGRVGAEGGRGRGIPGSVGEGIQTLSARVEDDVAVGRGGRLGFGDHGREWKRWES